MAHAEGNVAVLDSLLEIKVPSNPASAADQVEALLNSYRLRETTADRYAAGFAICTAARF